MKTFVLHILLLCFTLSSSLWAQNNTYERDGVEAYKEQGQYVRKSITYIDGIWLLDDASRMMSSSFVDRLSRDLQAGIHMDRFDFNPVPSFIMDHFIREANRVRRPNIDELIRIMNRTVVDPVLEYVKANQEGRAAELLSEYQKNSWAADKAGEAGFTSQELDKVLNSAYIYVPVVSGFSLSRSKDSYVGTIRAGIIWFKIEGGRATLLKKDMSTCVAHGAGFSPRRNAMDGLSRCVVRNLVTSTKEIEDFKFRAQIVGIDGRTIELDQGKKQGLRVGDRMLLGYYEENNETGKTELVESGWVLVTDVADSSDEVYLSEAHRFGDEVAVGDVVSEYPRLGLDLRINMRRLALDVKHEFLDTLEESTSGMGIEASIAYNIGAPLGVNQLFLGLGAMAGKVDLTQSDKSLSIAEVNFFMRKKFIVGPLFWSFFAGGGVLSGQLSDTDGLGSDQTIENGVFQAGSGLELPLGPSATLFAEYNWQRILNSENSSGGYYFENFGHEIRAGINWTLPHLPFDPLNLLLGI